MGDRPRRATDRRLSEEGAVTATCFEGVGCAVTVTDAEGTIVAMNPVAAATFAADGGAALVGRSVLDCHPEPSRTTLAGMLAGARIPMQVDVGFGDAIVPAPIRTAYPTFLGHPAPSVLAYPREAAVAEKLEAIVTLGVTTSRMKDFFDIAALASGFTFEGSVLAAAIRATIARRGTPVPEGQPVALSPGFLGAPERQVQWRAFLRRSRLNAVEDAVTLAADLWRFLGPVLAALERAEPFVATWPPRGPWR